jgi:hypothetical protein
MSNRKLNQINHFSNSVSWNLLECFLNNFQKPQIVLTTNLKLIRLFLVLFKKSSTAKMQKL